MGKNRKAQHYATQFSYSSSEDNQSEVPTEFLTSDDFKIVLPRRHQSKKSLDSPDEAPFASRSRNNSYRLSVCSDDSLGCYSSFWKSECDEKSQEITTDAKEDAIADQISELEIEDVDSDVREAELNKINSSNEQASVMCDKETCGKSSCDIESGNNLNGVGSKSLESKNISPIETSNGERDLHKVPLLLEFDREDHNYAIIESSSLNDVVNDTKPKSHKKKKRPNLKTSESSGDASSASPTTCSDEPSFNTANGKQERKKPSKKKLAAIHEAIRKAKEAEEKLKAEEEARKKEIEMAEIRRQEMLKMEEERKNKKKLKEKARKEKLKSEGRLLSKSQKQARARMLATIEIYRQQGVDIPQIGDKPDRSLRSGSYKNSCRRRFDSTQSDKSDVSRPGRHKTESLSSQESKESFSDIPNSFESKESLDFISIGSLATESDTGRCSFSEDSDALDEDNSDKSKKSAQNISSESARVLEDKKPEARLRSPVICVLGHVDTGKTKLLDYIRKTHVQDSEAGGITQQIGATMIPQSALKDKCKMVKDFASCEVKVPGLLVIDTPGHESFRNLRSRGTSLCDIAILVVDIMHGLQAQTLESLNLLKASKIPFVVALNKVDRIYGWESFKDVDLLDAIQNQNENTQWEFKRRCQDIIVQFAKECINASLYYENSNPRTYVSMVPISAVTGDGMGNILSLLTHLTQTLMYKQLCFSDELKATVLEVKVTPGLGTTIDVILVNGYLREGDTIVLASQDGPIVTQIRSLLMPQPLREFRVKNPYKDYKSVKGAQGVKISGKDLDKALAGMPLFVAKSPSQIDSLRNEITQLINQAVNHIKTSERGVYVQASTLGSLEALLDYLTISGVPYFGVKVGPVVKKDVVKASIMLEHDVQYACILAFDVKVDKDAQELADHLGVKILSADIIYHLNDMFIEHRDNYRKKLDEKLHLAIFPCIVNLLAKTSTSADTSVVVLHATVDAGSVRNGTPLCVPKLSNIVIGTVFSIQVDGQIVECAKEGQSALLTLDSDLSQPLELNPGDTLVSRISRQSIEVLKEYYKDEVSSTDWHLMSDLKRLLNTV